MDNKKKEITIRYNNDTKYIILDTLIIKKTVLKEYFRKEGTLSYEMNGKSYLLDTDNENIYLRPEIDVYYFTPCDDYSTPKLCDKRVARLKDLVDRVHNNKGEDKSLKKMIHTNLIPSNQKISNKKQEKAKNKSSDKKSFIPRILNVGWRHKLDYNGKFESMGIIGKSKRITLNFAMKYTYEEVKAELLRQYIDEDNKYHFERSVTFLGRSDGTQIFSFKNSEGEDCDFWVYCNEKLRNRGNYASIFLLSTKVQEMFEKRRKIKSSTTTESANKKIHESLKLSVLSSLTKKSEISEIVGSQKMALATHNNQHILKTTNKTNIENGKIMPRSYNDHNSFKTTSIMSNSINSHQYSIDSPLYSVPTKPSIPNIPLLLKKKTLTVDNENENVEIKTRKLDKQNFPISKVDDHQFLKPITSVVKKNQENLNVSIHQVEEHQIEFSNKVLGEGAQGIVRMGKYCNGIVAIKSMQKGRYEKMIMREIKLLDKIRHVNIIAISAYCSAATQFHIVMEYFKSSNLNDIIFTKDIREKFDLNLHKKNEIAYQISCGLTYLHMQPTPIIHRDIKPGNILVSDDLKVKICDLGLAKGGILLSNLDTTCIGSLKGTYVFMAPELILKRKEATVYSDVWSFAVTLVELYNQDHSWEPSLFFCNILVALTNLFNRSKIPDTKLIPSFLKSKVLQCFSYSDISRPPAKDLLLLLEKECGYSMKTTELSDF